MTRLQALQHEVVGHPPEDRSALITVLLHTFKGPAYDVSDEEVMRRDEEMESGMEKGLSHRQFVRAIKARRRR
jgi:hypothetical protein